MNDLEALSRHFREIKNTLTGILNRTLLKYDISPVMMYALELLLKHPEFIAADIAAQVGITRGAVTQLLDKMEQMGLVVRRPHLKSRRSLQIVVTDEGHRLAEAVLKDYHEQIGRLFAGYAGEELAQLRQLLDKLDL